MIEQHFRPKREGGYIALISVIVISVTMIALTAAVSLTAYLGRDSQLSSELKEISSGAAESCLQYAYGLVAQNPDYLPPIGGQEAATTAGSCKVCEVAASGPQRTIRVRGFYRRSYTNLAVAVTPVPPGSPRSLRVDSWGEDAIYPGPSCPLP